jgi:hypothetical protein
MPQSATSLTLAVWVQDVQYRSPASFTAVFGVQLALRIEGLRDIDELRVVIGLLAYAD